MVLAGGTLAFDSGNKTDRFKAAAKTRVDAALNEPASKTDGLGKGHVGVTETGWKARASWLISAHEQPNGQSTATKPFDELGPGEAIGIQRKRSHHQIQNLFVFSNQRRAVRRVQLRNLFELDLPELGQRC